MDDGWRVSLTFPGRPAIGKKPPYPPESCAMLRGRLPGDVTVSAGKTAVFLYASTEAAAVAAERVAQEVFAQCGLSPDSRLGWWDAVGQVWRDANGEPLDHGAEPPPRRSRGKAAAKVIGNVAEAIIESF